MLIPSPRIRFRNAAVTLAALALLAAPPLARDAAAQRRHAADVTLSASLLAAATPFPGAPHGKWMGPLSPPRGVTFELQHSHAPFGQPASPVVILGVKAERARYDSSGHSAARFGLRVGVHAPREAVTGEAGESAMSMLELHAGIHRLSYLTGSSIPDLGIEAVVGWSNVGSNARGYLGFRFPLEWVRRYEQSWVAFSAAPTVAWGHIRTRECEDLGSGDNCGDLGVQAAFGRTRFVLAGGVSYGIEPAGLAFTLGAQRLMATGEDPRVVAGVSWSR